MHLRNVLESLGYVKSQFDDCIFTKVGKNTFSIISTHVDDILQVTNSSELVEHLHNGLVEAYTNVQFNEFADSYLGMSINRSSDGHIIHVDQSGSICELVNSHLPVNESRKCKTPQTEDLFNNNFEDSSIELASRLDENFSKKFLSIVMSLMYIARLTRPDILLPVSYLATRSHIATKEDWEKLLRVLRYLRDSQKTIITIKCEELQLYCHCDASYGVHQDGRSHTGYMIYMGKNLSYVLSKSCKQKTGSTSSTDAEVIALVDCLKVAVWLKNILVEFDINPVNAVMVYQDNQSGMKMINDMSKCKRSKHILTKINYAKDLVDSGIVVISYLNTVDMSADLLTKPLEGSLFVKHKNTIMGTLLDTNNNIVSNSKIT
jgi:hypothetical protein